MKSRSLARHGRTLSFATLLLALTVAAAFPQGNPPPPPPPVGVPPIALDSLGLPYVDRIVVGHVDCATCPPRTCPGEPVQVRVSGLLGPCVQFRGLHQDDSQTIPVVVADFVVDTCAAACPRLILPFSGGTSLPPQGPGERSFVLRITVRTCPDTTAVASSADTTVTYTVQSECPAPPGPCVVRQMQSNVPALQCALTLAPGDTGSVPLLYSSELPMAGAQGIISVLPPFKLMDLRVASGLTGVHLSMARDIGGVRWVVFTDPGVTLAPGANQHLFDATVAVDPAAPHGLSQLMTATITLASDEGGNRLPLCDRETLVAVAIRLCTAAAGNSACDVNHDGQLDVRDLVRMVGCLKHGAVDTSGACVDCDSSGVFDIADIFCCARDILRGPGVPRDSVHSDAAVSVSFDPIEAMGGGDLLVRVRVRGAHALSAGLLRLDYPGELWNVSDVATPATGARPVDADWYPMIDHLDSGHIYVGAVRVGDTGSDEFSFEVAMVPSGSLVEPPASADQIKVTSADLAALDGSVVTPKDPLPTVALQVSQSPGITAVELAPARPNPFNGSTTFVIRLPATAPVDLAVHDLAGRRVTTIAHAVYGPGEHTFSWDGGGARDGLYFVRLAVNGQVFSTRVAMLRDGR